MAAFFALKGHSLLNRFLLLFRNSTSIITMGVAFFIIRHKQTKPSRACSVYSLPPNSYIFGSIVDNQAIEYKCQNFHKVAVHVIIIDQCNQTAR